MLQFSVLASGSKANCTYVSDGETRILIDCGLSGRETARRLNLHGIEAESIDALVVTHEHRDHVCGVPTFAKRYRIPVYSNPAVLSRYAPFRNLPEEKLLEFQTGEAFQIGGLQLHPFSVMHDCLDPVAFRIEAGEMALGLVTDLGQVTPLVREHTRSLDALILESNHDLDLLHESPYPWELKQRIKGRSGHLSNEDAASLLGELSQEPDCRLRVVVAAHISENSNLPELAIDGFRTAWQSASNDTLPQIVAGSPYETTRLFQLGEDERYVVELIHSST